MCPGRGNIAAEDGRVGCGLLAGGAGAGLGLALSDPSDTYLVTGWQSGHRMTYPLGKSPPAHRRQNLEEQGGEGEGGIRHMSQHWRIISGVFPEVYDTSLQGFKLPGDRFCLFLFFVFYCFTAIAPAASVDAQSHFVVVQSLRRVQLWNPMDCNTPDFPVHHHLPEFAQTHVRRVRDAIQPSHPLSAPSPPAFKLSQHQGLFQ